MVLGVCPAPHQYTGLRPRWLGTVQGTRCRHCRTHSCPCGPGPGRHGAIVRFTWCHGRRMLTVPVPCVPGSGADRVAATWWAATPLSGAAPPRLSNARSTTPRWVGVLALVPRALGGSQCGSRLPYDGLPRPMPLRASYDARLRFIWCVFPRPTLPCSCLFPHALRCNATHPDNSLRAIVSHSMDSHPRTLDIIANKWAPG